MVSTKHGSRGESVGSFPIAPRTPPRPAGFRTKWHILSSSARGLLCTHPPDDAYENHWPSNNKVALHAPARSKSRPSSRDTTTPPPWNVARGRSSQIYTKEVAKDEAREAIWDDNMTTAATTATKFSLPGSKLSPGGATSAKAPLIEESGARPPGSESPLYDAHVGTPLRFNGTQSRGLEAGQQKVATGDTIEALIDAILQIEDSEEEEYDIVANLVGTSLLGAEAAMDDKSMVFGMEDDGVGVGVGVGEREEEKTDDCSATVAGEEDDPPRGARQAWEDMKKRVMYIEEFGALPLDGATGAGAGDAERASREWRARLRRSWAEKTIRVHTPPPREEIKKTRRTSANSKKRRRHAGCWVREDGVFMGLYARRM